MTRHRHAHADEHVRSSPPAAAQLAGTMFDAPPDSLEDASGAADESSTLSARAKLRRQVLQLYAIAGDVGLTADQVTAAFGSEDHNSYAPRVCELADTGYLTRLDGKDGRECRRRATRKGSGAFVLVITAAGLAQLAQRQRSA